MGLSVILDDGISWLNSLGLMECHGLVCDV